MLHTVYQMPMGVLNAMVARIKLLGAWTWWKAPPLGWPHQDPQPARRGSGNALSTLPTAFGEKMVMCIFDPDNTVKTLDALGFIAA